MPYLRRKLNHGRKKADENNADPGSSAAKVVRHPRVKNPAEEGPGNDRRRAEHEKRHAKRTPEVQQKDKERGVGTGDAPLVGERPRSRERRTRRQRLASAANGDEAP